MDYCKVVLVLKNNLSIQSQIFKPARANGMMFHRTLCLIYYYVFSSNMIVNFTVSNKKALSYSII